MGKSVDPSEASGQEEEGIPPLPFPAVSLCFTQELSIFLLPERSLGCPPPIPHSSLPQGHVLWLGA